MRVVVRYDAAFSRTGTWILAPEGDGIRARFRLGEAPELIVDAKLRWLRPGGDGRTYVRPIDGSTWVTECSRFEGQIEIPIVLQLSGCPERVADVLRTL